MKYTAAITSQSSTFSIDNSHETWTLAAGQTITSSSIGIFEWSDYHENTIVVNGSISAGMGSSAGIDTFGDKTTITVGGTGTISGLHGIRAFGDEFSLINHGSITAANTAVHIEGDHSQFVNHGAITGNIFADSADRLDIVIGKDGTVNEDTGYAITIDSGTGQTAHIVNHGSVTGAPTFSYAFNSTDGDETLINDGTLVGHVDLGDGNDVFDNRGGTVTAGYHISGDDGDDLFILDSKIQIGEGFNSGTDTIKSTISMNISSGVMAGSYLENLTLLGANNHNATGNELGNVIKGNSGDNHLSGLAGDDILAGGKGADIFIFKTGFDHDAVTDFGLGADRIDLSDFSAVTGFADLMAHHVTKSGLDLIIHAGTDHLTLEHVSKADLQASDFIF